MQLLNNETSKLPQTFTGELKAFYEFHGVQLISCGFPTHLIQRLYQKLTNNQYDVGESFKIMDDQDRGMYFVQALKDMKKEQDVWVLDHIITFRYPELRGKLEGNLEMLARIKEMTKYLGTKFELSKPQQNSSTSVESLTFEHDSQGLETVTSLQIPKNTVCLSLVDNNLNDPEEIINLVRDLKKLRVLWINDNPVSDNQTLAQFIQNTPNIEMFNSKLTKHATEWIYKYLVTKSVCQAKSMLNQNVYSIDLSGRQIFNTNLQILKSFPNLHQIIIQDTLSNSPQQLDQLSQLMRINSLRQIKCDFELETQIFALYKNNLEGINRDLLINDHNIYMPAATETSADIDQVQRRIFKLANCYRLADSSQMDETSVWYVNDEIGSALSHSDSPQCKTAPFLYAPNRKMDSEVQAYTLLWLCKDVKEGGVVQRDFLNGLGEDKQRSSRLAVWYEIPRDIYINLYEGYSKNLQKIAANFKVNSDLQGLEWKVVVKEKFKVMTDNKFLHEYLTLPEFEITDNLEDVDIFWMNVDTKSNELIREKITKGAFNNQFRMERCITTKNGLANTIQSVLGQTSFLQRTYDLQSQLPIFIGHFFDNQRKGLDNLWISKPPNMARSMDMLVSNNLEVLIRNMETGPKLVQKYITSPVRRLARKIDLRFIVVVKSIAPLQVYIYKHFWIRTSNNEYNVDCRYREEYETHFTVMNYGKKLTQVNYPDFIEEFEKDYSPVKWEAVYEKIKEMFRQTFIAVQTKYPEMNEPSSRACYGMDVMVDGTSMEPKLLECTFSPDCARACKFYPTFYNDLFEVLFLERDNASVEPLFRNKN